MRTRHIRRELLSLDQFCVILILYRSVGIIGIPDHFYSSTVQPRVMEGGVKKKRERKTKYLLNPSRQSAIKGISGSEPSDYPIQSLAWAESILSP